MPDIDFFVHPEFAILSPDRSMFRGYARAIVEKARSSSNPILVNSIIRDKDSRYSKGYEEIRFFDRFIPDSARHLLSNSVEAGEEYLSYGHIHHSSWKRLEEICAGFDETSNIRIHGCFYESQCCQNLAVQLYGLLKFKRHWYDWREMPSVYGVFFEEARINLFDMLGSLSRTNIRYGVVFSSETIGINNKFSFIPKHLSFLRYVNDQLTDGDTEIYGRP